MGGFVTEVARWFSDGSRWSGPDGVLARLGEHLGYSLLSTLVAALVALPIGMLIGHTGRGAVLVVTLSGFGRALPTVGVVVLVFLVSGLTLWPVYVALVALAIPVIVTNTCAGIGVVDPGVRDAARGIGLTGWQVLVRVELPLAVPLVVNGVRQASVQVVATATIAAYLGFGGLGRFVFDGFAQNDLPQVFGGALLIAALAVALDLALGVLQRALTPRALATRSRRSDPP